MTDTNGRREIELSRRNVLASVGALGAAGALGGAGTAAFFSDEEQFEDNTLVAGEFDLMVDWQEHYFDGSDDEVDGLNHPVEVVNGGSVPSDYVGLPDPRNPLIAVHEDDLVQFMDNTANDAWPDEDGNDIQDTIHPRQYFLQQGYSLEETEAKFRAQFANVPQDLGGRKLIDLSDVKPGDFGEVTFSTHLFDNPGYIWLNGRLLANAENGVNEAEASDQDEDDPLGENSGTSTSGELADAVRALVWYDDGDNLLDDEEWVYMPHGIGDDANITLTREEAIITEGSLREVLDELSTGNGIPLDRDPRTEDRDCFENSTTRYLGFAWWLPVDHANELQSDYVEFDLGFYAEQCRHNDGRGLPPEEVVLGGDYADLSGFATTTADGVVGGGAWSSDSSVTNADGGAKEQLYLGPAFADFDPLPSFTVADVDEISYHTKKPGGQSDVDYYLLIYTEPEGDGDDDASWYDKRLNAEPMWSANLNAPANQWNEWSTSGVGSGDENRLRFYDSNRPGQGFGWAGAMPTLQDLQAGPLDWSAYAGGSTDVVDYSTQTVKTLSIQTASGWQSGFTGLLDAVTVRLTDGQTMTVDLEA